MSMSTLRIWLAVAIIVCTARAVKGDREACLAADMDGYLAKPIQAAQLYQAIADVVGSDPELESR